MEEVFAVNLKEISEEEQFKCMKKLHSQFGHTVKDKFKTFMKDAEQEKHLDKIIESFDGCIKRKKTQTDQLCVL